MDQTVRNLSDITIARINSKSEITKMNDSRMTIVEDGWVTQTDFNWDIDSSHSVPRVIKKERYGGLCEIGGQGRIN